MKAARKSGLFLRCSCRFVSALRGAALSAGTTVEERPFKGCVPGWMRNVAQDDSAGLMREVAGHYTLGRCPVFFPLRWDRRFLKAAALRKDKPFSSSEESVRKVYDSVFTCSGRKPIPTSRAGIRRRNGHRRTSFKIQGSESGLLLPRTRRITLFCITS